MFKVTIKTLEQDYFKPMYFFLQKDIARTKILTSKNQLTKQK